ncbi:FMRFamide receptor [Sarcoptes scabiei]|nr:FMRFamide receptor [Sarcoptes scabiei]
MTSLDTRDDDSMLGSFENDSHLSNSDCVEKSILNHADEDEDRNLKSSEISDVSYERKNTEKITIVDNQIDGRDWYATILSLKKIPNQTDQKMLEIDINKADSTSSTSSKSSSSSSELGTASKTAILKKDQDDNRASLANVTIINMKPRMSNDDKNLMDFIQNNETIANTNQTDSFDGKSSIIEAFRNRFNLTKDLSMFGLD